MSNHHPNAFRPRGPMEHDVSRAPVTAQQAWDRHVAPRDGEVTCLASTRLRPQTIAGARLWTEITTVEAPSGLKTKMVSMRVLDHRGIDVIAQLDITTEDLAILAKRLGQIHKTLGGDMDALLEKE